MKYAVYHRTRDATLGRLLRFDCRTLEGAQLIADLMRRTIAEYRIPGECIVIRVEPDGSESTRSQ